MRKLFFIFLIWPFLCQAQTKPDIAVLQPGWSDSCLRAIPLTEGSGEPTDLTGKSTPTMTAGGWGNDTEGFYFDSGGGTRIIDFDIGLPGANVNKYTVYMRFIEVCSGSCGVWYATFIGGVTLQSDVQVYHSFVNEALDFSVRNTTNCATCQGTITLSNTPIEEKYNFIGEYDGDSLRSWINNVRNCSIKLTNGGNILNSGYTSRVAQGQNSNSDGCQGSAVSTGFVKVYTIFIWKRLLTASERAQIQADPYVMFRIPASTIYHFRNGGFKNSEFKKKGFKNAGFK